MKKHFFKIIPIILICFIFSSCSDIQNYVPTSDSTWEDLCTHFHSEWFSSLPSETQNQFHDLKLNSTPSKKEIDGIVSITDSTPVYSYDEDDTFSVYGDDHIILYTQDNLLKSNAELSIMIKEESNQLLYSITASSFNLNEPLKLNIALALYNVNSGEYLGVHTFSITDNESLGTKGHEFWEQEGKFKHLKQGEEYNIKLFAVVTPPNNLHNNGDFYISKNIKIK